MDGNHQGYIKLILLFVAIYIVFVLGQSFRILDIKFISSNEVNYGMLKAYSIIVISIPLIASFFLLVPAWFLFEINSFVFLPKLKINFNLPRLISVNYEVDTVDLNVQTKLQVVRC